MTAVSGATGGTGSLVSGTITFDPAQDVCEPGTFGFNYTVSDGNGGTDTGHVDVRIDCVNDPPVAVDDETSPTRTPTRLDATAAGAGVSPVDNDTDADGDTRTVTAVCGATGGTVSLDSGTITFDPAQDVCEPGTFGFNYTVSDGNGGTDTGHVDVNVDCVNDAPVAVDDEYVTNEDTTSSDPRPPARASARSTTTPTPMATPAP